MKEYRDYSEYIKQQVTMREVAEKYGFAVTTRARKIRCPFHDDSKPSMQIYPGDRGWFCWVCNEGGSVIDFVMRYFGLDYISAIKKLNDDFSLRLDIDKPMNEAERKKAAEAYQKRQEERRKREERVKLLYTIYHAALDRYCFLDMLRMENMPEKPGDPVSPEYAYAVKRIDDAWYEVNKAERKIREFEEAERQ